MTFKLLNWVLRRANCITGRKSVRDAGVASLPFGTTPRHQRRDPKPGVCQRGCEISDNNGKFIRVFFLSLIWCLVGRAEWEGFHLLGKELIVFFEKLVYIFELTNSFG